MYLLNDELLLSDGDHEELFSRINMCEDSLSSCNFRKDVLLNLYI